MDRMSLRTDLYTSLAPTWPRSGRHILASFDEETIVVYQAYRPEIAEFAVRHGRFGGEFSFSRMSWIKPNFLWMMFRSGWGEKPNQERTLALRIRRTFFDNLLSAAVPSTWDRDRYESIEEWQTETARSDVRLQWDPDHHPSGAPLGRRAIQLGLRGEALRKFGQEELQEVIDSRGSWPDNGARRDRRAAVACESLLSALIVRLNPRLPSGSASINFLFRICPHDEQDRTSFL